MIGLIQRVTEARVEIASISGRQTVGEIGCGLLAFIGVTPSDTESNAARLAQRLINYRVFEDAAGRMNLSVRDISGGILLVPQFTLAADTRKGSRPGFSTAAAPGPARALYDKLVSAVKTLHPVVAEGCFGAEMHVSLVNHGPVTFWLDA